MGDTTMIDRLVRVGRQRGGERLLVVSGRPAALFVGESRLEAGNAVPDAAEVRSWLHGVIPETRWAPFELGEEVAFATELDGETVGVRARQASDVVHVEIAFGKATAHSAAEPFTPRGGGEAPATTAVPAPTVAATPLDRMLCQLVKMGGSDLHLSAGCPPLVRVHGDVAPLPGVALPLASDHIRLMCDEIAPAEKRREFREENDADFAYEMEGVARFRVNVFRDRRGVGAVFRQIPSRILSLEDLGLPECVRTLCSLRKGLVLVTGPTGSGKSTTLAAMVDLINATRREHIITIEDPIEFVHENKSCLINQREVHSHTGSFRRALRAALREDPDIILVGELRDLETMAIAIETAETGHLVLGTLHTTTAVSTVDRLVDQFPADRQEQIRVMVAECLKGVIAQILLKRRTGGRIAAYEILLGIPAVANLIREGKTHQLPSVIQTNKQLGMQLLNDALADLVRRDEIDVDEALAKAVDKEGLRAVLKLRSERPTAE